MEMKWTMISVAIVFTAMFVGLGFNEYNKAQCRIEAIKADYTKEAIKEICH